MSNYRLTEEEFNNLSPDGERAAIRAGIAPEGVPNPFMDEPTDLTDVLTTVMDYVQGSVPPGSRLETTVADALEEAIEVFEGDEPEDNFEAKFKFNGATVSIERANGDGQKTIEIVLDAGGQIVFITVKVIDQDQIREAINGTINELFGALMGAAR